MRNLFRDRQALEPWAPGLALVAVAAAVVVIPAAFGASLITTFTAAALVLGVGNAVLGPRLSEAGRRRPQLSLRVEEAAGLGPEVRAPHLRPWPLSIERIVRNAIEEATESSRSTFNSPSHLRHVASFPFASSAYRAPSEADRRRAFSEYTDETLPKYEEQLRAWLESYVRAASARGRTFTLTVRISNHRKGAHADDVRVELRIPSSVEVVDEAETTHEWPPTAPLYVEPKSTPLRTLPGGLPTIGAGWPSRRLKAAVQDLYRELPKHHLSWSEPEPGLLRTTLARVHAGESPAVEQPLVFRVTEPGLHSVSYTIRSTSARTAVEGTIDLCLPASPSRPPFGRLGGITAYPDVALKKADDPLTELDPPVNDIVAARTTDPPLSPPDSAGAQAPRNADRILDRIREVGAFNRWLALGLDPRYDGPDPVRVGEPKQIPNDDNPRRRHV